jgi:uncharacterized protein YdaT
MPWNEAYYPRSMKSLPPAVRSKAIEIANALLESGREEGSAIRIAIAKAKEWAAAHGIAPEGAGLRRFRS